MSGLNRYDLVQLRAYADAGDRYGYYTYLAVRGDSYAPYARDVVTGDTLAGYVANEYLRGALFDARITPTPELMQDIGVRLMRGDLAARVTDIAENSGTGLNLHTKP